MTERRAWLRQSEADLHAIARALDADDPGTYCHAIAKCQQAVEKGIKGLVAALRDSGVLSIEIGYRHEVSRFLKVLVKSPNAHQYPAVTARLRRLLDWRTRQAIEALDRLTPKRPPPGGLPARNTEYPFRTSVGEMWRSPGEKDIFGRDELEIYRAMAHRIVVECNRLVSIIEREKLPGGLGDGP